MVEKSEEQALITHQFDTPTIQVEGIEAEILDSVRRESKLAYDIFSALISANDTSNSPRRMEQLQALLYMPGSFVRRIEKHLQLAKEKKVYFMQKNGMSVPENFSFTPREINSRIKGELFEELVRAEFRKVQFGQEDEKVIRKKDKISRELMMVWQYPERYGISHSWRNPDAAFFEIDAQGRITIEAVGEVKSGNLDARAYAQLCRDGIELQLNDLIAELQGKSDEWFDHRNLHELKEQRYTLSIAKESFKIRLIVPRDKNVSEEFSEEEAMQLIKKTNEGKYAFVLEGNGQPSQVLVSSFVRVLQEERISVETSLFSTKELYQMAEVVAKYVDTLS